MFRREFQVMASHHSSLLVSLVHLFALARSIFFSSLVRRDWACFLLFALLASWFCIPGFLLEPLAMVTVIRYWGLLSSFASMYAYDIDFEPSSTTQFLPTYACNGFAWGMVELSTQGVNPCLRVGSIPTANLVVLLL